MTHFFASYAFSFSSLSSVKQLYDFGLNAANSGNILPPNSLFIKPITSLFFPLVNGPFDS